jgi:hypothetical protein
MWLINITKCEALFFLWNKILSKILKGDHHEKINYDLKKLWFEKEKWNVIF